MKVIGVTKTQLWSIAGSRDIHLANFAMKLRRTRRGHVEEFSFNLRPRGDQYRVYTVHSKHVQYEPDLFHILHHPGLKKSHRLTNAVCEHGHHDFIGDVFAANPGAVVETHLGRWNGHEPPFCPLWSKDSVSCKCPMKVEKFTKLMEWPSYPAIHVHPGPFYTHPEPNFGMSFDYAALEANVIAQMEKSVANIGKGVLEKLMKEMALENH